MIDDERISEIRRRHIAVGGISAAYECAEDYEIWPCDTAIVLARIDALAAERDAQADQANGWRLAYESRQRKVEELQAEVVAKFQEATTSRLEMREAKAERDALASRLAAAEAALREIEDVSCWQPRYLEWKRSAQKVGLCPSSDLAVNEIKHLARQALAALAGSREPATTTISDSGDSSRLSE